jgi:GNAT superfamily N-acetyltransferase
MEIRKYVLDDLDRVQELVAAVNLTTVWPKHHPCGWNKKRVEAEFQLNQYEDPLLLVALFKNRIVGIVAGHDLNSFVAIDIPHISSKFPSSMNLPTAYYQRDILCHPDFQGQGIATILMEKLETHAIRREYATLITRTVPDNSVGKNVFHRKGFSTLFEDDNPPRIYFSKTILRS